MPSFDSFDYEENSKPQPCKILCLDSEPISVIIEKPETTPDATQKATTSARLRQETAKAQLDIAFRLKTQGAVYSPDRRSSPARNWSSTRINENYLAAYASGKFGTAKAREAECVDMVAYEEARVACEGWTHRPWKGMIQGDLVWVETTFDDGRWEPVAAQPCVASPEAAVYTPMPATRLARKKITKEELNSAYEDYARNPEAELGNLHVALYTYAPMRGRRKECKTLLEKRETYLLNDDILADFVADLIHRIQNGQYHTHEGKIENWIGYVWKNWFFPDVQTKIYSETNLTATVSEYSVEDDQPLAVQRVPGETYRVDVDREQADRDKESWNDPSNVVPRMLRQMDDPNSVWGKINTQTKLMMRAMAKGASTGEAAESVGLSERQGRRKMEQVRKLAEANPDIRELLLSSPASLHEESNIICIDASADDGEDESFDICGAAEKFLTAEEAAAYLGGLNSRTMSRWAREGYIPAFPIGEGKRRLWRFLESDLERWMLARRTVAA